MIRKGMNVLNRVKLTKREWIFGGLTALLLLLLTLSFFLKTDNQSAAKTTDWNTPPTKSPISTSQPQKPSVKSIPVQSYTKKEIVIDVKGEVHTPGVYQMEKGKRVVDAVEKAGGFTDKADQTLMNLAKRLQDEMVIYVPKKGEKPSDIPNIADSNTGANSESTPSKIDVNTANETQLEALPGVGPATAKAIIDYRKKHGNFKKPMDLTNVPGIGNKTVNSFKDLLLF